MSKIEMSLSFPLDDDGFFRRECPLCHREFKVLLSEDERSTLTEKGRQSYLIEAQEESDGAETSEEEAELTCPYCGQQSPSNSWWTQEQQAYIGVVMQNVMARLVNERHVRPMKRMARQHSSGPVSLRFEGNEMKQHEPWISPEANDMMVFDLPCCQRKLKVDEEWNSVVYCFFCGFPHQPSSRDT